jgi:drug/metabolite transporter (DMT)-like permease
LASRILLASSLPLASPRWPASWHSRQPGRAGSPLLTGIIGAVGALSVFLATHRGMLAVTAVIYSLYPAGTIILARVRSDEHLTRAGMFGLCLAATSVSLIAAAAVR